MASNATRRRIELYPHQHDFVACGDRFAAFIAGIGSGKSYAGAVKMLYRASQRPSLSMVTAPTYPMLRDATLRVFFDVAGDAVTDYQKSEMLVTLTNGSEILFRSTDNPDRLRGPSLSNWWGDEAALYDRAVWPVMLGRLREGGRAGHAWLTSTPKGRNWLYERQGEMTLFRAHTADNPYLDSGFVASLAATYTGLFARQELDGEFVTYEGLVYDDFDRARHVTRLTGPWVRAILACDEGYTNPAVMLVIGADSDGRLHVMEEYYQRRQLQGVVVTAAVDMCRQHNVREVVVDPSAAGLIAEMRSVGLAVYEADNAVFPGIQRVKNALAVAGDGRPRLTIDPACVNTLAEFESYVWMEGRSGVKDTPEKTNDHAMDALRYGVACLASSRPQSRTRRAA